MLERVIDWSLAHRGQVLVGAVLVLVAGVVALRNLNVDAFADTTPVQVQINTQAPALVPEEVERQITFPVELALGGIPDLEEVRSISMYGLSQVVATFAEGTDVYFARQLVYQRLSGVELPPKIGLPELGPPSTGLGEVFHYLLVPRESARIPLAGRGSSQSAPIVQPSHERQLTMLRTTQDRKIKPVLRQVPNTAEVNSWGGFEKQYQVRLDPGKLRKFHLSFEQVVSAINQNNMAVGGGNIEASGDMLLVHGRGRTVTLDQIADIVIVAEAGVPVYVKDVADVAIGHAVRAGAVTATVRDSHRPNRWLHDEAVLGLGFALMGHNSYAVTKDLYKSFKNLMPEVAAELEAEGEPASSIEVVIAYDRTELVNRVIATVTSNLLEGACMVVLILFMFLGNLRAGLICATAIPLSMCVGFCGMWYAGIAGSLLSLGAIDFGLVVDSSIVMIDHIVHSLAGATGARARASLDTVRRAAIEVRTPAVFGQLIIMIVYLPILSLEGVEGRMFRPMALTVIFVLIGSLICSLSLTPVLASLLLNARSPRDVLIVRVARSVYTTVLERLLPWRRTLVVASLALLGWCAWIAAGLGTEFVPRLDEGTIVIGISRPPGTSLDENLRINQRMEKQLVTAFPDEVDYVWSRAGSPEVPTDASTVEMTDMFVSLRPRESWTKARNQAELVRLFEEKMRDCPGQVVWYSQPIEQRTNELISGARGDVAIKLFGEDFEQLKHWSEKIAKVLRNVPGCHDISTEQTLGQPILRIDVRQDELARYGVPVQSVMDIIESVGGKSVGEVLDGAWRFPLVVRLPESIRGTPESIAAILVESPSRELIPLSTLADVRIERGPRLISREWSKRRVMIQFNVRDRDVGSAVYEAQQKIAQEVLLPHGYSIEWGGQFENMRRAQRRLAIVGPISLSLILVLLYLAFRNRWDTAVIFGSIPFAMAGGILALWLRSMPLSISAAIGFITLSGVAVLNSMVIVSAMRREYERVQPSVEAILRASSESVRTVLITMMVASIGFLPMAVSDGAGAEVQRPLASVVIGGMLVGTIATLILLPAFYAWRASRFRVF